MSGRAIGSLSVVVILSASLLLLQLGTPVPSPASFAPPLAILPAWLPVNLLLVIVSIVFLGLAWHALRRRPAPGAALEAPASEPTLREHGPVLRTADEPPPPALVPHAVTAQLAPETGPVIQVVDVVDEPPPVPALAAGSKVKIESELTDLLAWLHGVSETLDHIAKAPAPAPTVRTRNGRVTRPPPVIIGIEEPAPTKARRPKARRGG